jgi:GDP-L-fucose synthase
MFGPGDHFDPKESHVIGALMYRMTEARERRAEKVEIWGTGRARREFVYIDDIARACIFLMRSYDGGEPINLGGGEDVSIKELALLLKDVTRYAGEIVFDESKPDGMPLKSLDSQQLLDLGWRPQVSFRDALDRTYASFVQGHEASREHSLGATLPRS